MLAQALPREQVGVLRHEWAFERKLDGLRCIAVKRGPVVEMWSRNRLSFLGRFPRLAGAVAAIPVDDFTLDGEVVVYDGSRTSFTLLQNPRPDHPPTYCAFDLLHLLGQDTTPLPLADRFDLLGRVLSSPPAGITMPERLHGDPESLLRDACSQGWEGLIAKRLSSTYRGGRTPDWRKLKCTARQEFVIGGWTDPSSGHRSGFGALLIGYYGNDGVLHYAGKVGTGFDEKTLRSVHGQLHQIATGSPPFAEVFRMKGVHWVRPELVAEIEFSEWTREGRLRHPSFLGLREDKLAEEVRLESRPGG
jgi:bifunctional non-homologous end joining protein LigD